MDVGCGMGYFSIGLAKIVGKYGKVIAVDLQEEMLSILTKRAEKAGVKNQIHIHKCEAADIGIYKDVDFILAFWMVHETPDPFLFFRQLASILKPNGKLLVAEPKMHVTADRFQKIVSLAEKSGLHINTQISIAFSRAVVLSKR